MKKTTEFHCCPAVSRNYGGKTKEIIIIIIWFTEGFLLRIFITNFIIMTNFNHYSCSLHRTKDTAASEHGIHNKIMEKLPAETINHNLQILNTFFHDAYFPE